MSELITDGKLVSLLQSSTKGFGIPNQGINSFDLQRPELLTREELIVLYRHYWLAKRVVNVFPQDCTKDWILPLTFGEDSDEELPDEVDEYLKKLGARECFRERDRYARLFPGGAFIYIGADDGQQLDQPLKEKNIKTITELMVFDSYELVPEAATNRFDPEIFVYYPADYTNGRDLESVGPGTRIHKSRILTQLGEATTHWDYYGDRQLPSDPVLQCLYKPMVQYLTNAEAAGGMLQDHDILIHKIAGLADIIKMGKGKELSEHVQEVFTTLSMFRIWLQDGDREDSSRISHSFGGVKDTVEISRDEVTAATGIPWYKIWGSVGKAGLSDSGRAEERAWAAQVMAYQQEKYRPGLERLIELIFHSKDGPTNQELPETWEFEFKSIYQPTPEEEAELRSKYATVDSTNINAGVYDGDEARQRYIGKEFKPELVLEPVEVGESDGLLPNGFGLPEGAVEDEPTSEDVETEGEPVVEPEVPEVQGDRDDALVPVLGTAPLGGGYGGDRQDDAEGAIVPVLGLAPMSASIYDAIAKALKE